MLAPGRAGYMLVTRARQQPSEGHVPRGAKKLNPPIFSWECTLAKATIKDSIEAPNKRKRSPAPGALLGMYLEKPIIGNEPGAPQL